MAPKSNSASRPCFLVRYWNCGATSPCACSGSAAPERVQHVERRWMEGRGAGFLAQRRGPPRTPSPGCRGEPDWPPRRGRPGRRRRSERVPIAQAWRHGCYSILAMPALVMMSRYFDLGVRGISSPRPAASRMVSAPAFSKPCLHRGSLSAAVSSLLSFSRIGFGVPAGASSANQPLTLYCGRPLPWWSACRAARECACRRRPRAGWRLGAAAARRRSGTTGSRAAPCRQSGRGRIARCCDRARG